MAFGCLSTIAVVCLLRVKMPWQIITLWKQLSNGFLFIREIHLFEPLPVVAPPFLLVLLRSVLADFFQTGLSRRVILAKLSRQLFLFTGRGFIQLSANLFRRALFVVEEKITPVHSCCSRLGSLGIFDHFCRQILH